MIAMFLAMLESEEDRTQFLKLHSAYEIKMMFFIAGHLDIKEMVAYAKSIQIKQ